MGLSYPGGNNLTEGINDTHSPAVFLIGQRAIIVIEGYFPLEVLGEETYRLPYEGIPLSGVQVADGIIV